MAELSRFFNSVNGDRRYMAEEFAEFFNQFLTNGVYHTNFIPTLAVGASGANMNVYVEPGSALINGYMYKNTTNKTLTIENADAQDRIDRIVLRMDRNMEARNITANIIKGTPSVNPEPPELTRTNYIYELSLAQIYVNKNVVSVDDSDITDERRNSAVCGLVRSMITDSFMVITDKGTGYQYKMGIENKVIYLERVVN